ncbi:MAG: lipoate-protein ligase B [Tistrella sp.]|nr:lipoate-protein ligase B [Tistrella sp.]
MAGTLQGDGIRPVEWVIAPGLTDYEAAVAEMEARAARIREGTAGERVWLVEHPPILTAGTSAQQDRDLLVPPRFPIYRTGRGGQITYHGPGQRVAYVMLDLKARGADIRAYVHGLENWVIRALDRFNVKGLTRDDRVGAWVERGDGFDDKIAAIGVRVRRWVSFHGISLNVEPDLGHYAGIVPCGVQGHGITSLVALGRPVGMVEADMALREAFEEVFGPTTDEVTAERGS